MAYVVHNMKLVVKQIQGINPQNDQIDKAESSTKLTLLLSQHGRRRITDSLSPDVNISNSWKHAKFQISEPATTKCLKRPAFLTNAFKMYIP